MREEFVLSRKQVKFYQDNGYLFRHKWAIATPCRTVLVDLTQVSEPFEQLWLTGSISFPKSPALSMNFRFGKRYFTVLRSG